MFLCQWSVSRLTETEMEYKKIGTFNPITRSIFNCLWARIIIGYKESEGWDCESIDFIPIGNPFKVIFDMEYVENFHDEQTSVQHSIDTIHKQ